MLFKSLISLALACAPVAQAAFSTSAGVTYSGQYVSGSSSVKITIEGPLDNKTGYAALGFADNDDNPMEGAVIFMATAAGGKVAVDQFVGADYDVSKVSSVATLDAGVSSYSNGRIKAVFNVPKTIAGKGDITNQKFYIWSYGTYPGGHDPNNRGRAQNLVQTVNPDPVSTKDTPLPPTPKPSTPAPPGPTQPNNTGSPPPAQTTATPGPSTTAASGTVPQTVSKVATGLPVTKAQTTTLATAAVIPTEIPSITAATASKPSAAQAAALSVVAGVTSVVIGLVMMAL
ncbi:hypothetical protein HDU97_001516 [Phlyctochytrium planicorne]|nr:hypothetical protein HDU97_001516 [Phlyctochytrium planicorne]